MSKAVRIREHLYTEIASLAQAEHRSLIAQLEVLLEQALALRGSYPDLAESLRSSGAAVGYPAGSGSAPRQGEDRGPSSRTLDHPERAAPDHFKPDPK